MASDEYQEYLHSEKWAGKRLLRIRQSGFQCEGCKAQPDLFHVHHLTYARIFDEPMGDLMTLCERCHENVEGFILRGRLLRTGKPEELRNQTIRLIREQVSKPPKRRAVKKQAERDERRKKHLASVAANLAWRAKRKQIESERMKKRESSQNENGRAVQKIDRRRDATPEEVAEYLKQQPAA